MVQNAVIGKIGQHLCRVCIERCEVDVVVIAGVAIIGIGRPGAKIGDRIIAVACVIDKCVIACATGNNVVAFACGDRVMAARAINNVIVAVNAGPIIIIDPIVFRVFIIGNIDNVIARGPIDDAVDVKMVPELSRSIS
nr:hypothetical protein [Yoonia sp. I 8.24]